MTKIFKDNLKEVETFLASYKKDTLPHFINGSKVYSESGATFENSSPIDNQVIGKIAAGDSTDIDTACEAAHQAFGEWKTTSGKIKKKLLHKIADGIEKRAHEIALVESYDSGQAIRYMSKAAMRSAANFRFFADMAPTAADGKSLLAEEHMNYSMRQPIGPVGIITPWNTPFMLATWKIAPALAAGCTVVHKPAEWSPYTAMILAEIIHDAGLPDGVLNVVHGLGETAGKALTEDERIKAIAFVGESSTGSQIMKQGADTLKRVHFELGGKNPVIVFDDADLERALDAVVLMIFSLNGERCTSSSRLLIQESIKEEFLEKVQQRISKLKVGHPLDPETEIGPLIHKKHLDKVLGYFECATKEGARIIKGGKISNKSSIGNYVEPTLFIDVDNSMKIAQEEIFGPVLSAISFVDESHALKIANDVNYGLAAYLWTNDVGRSVRLSQQLEAGMIWINSENNRHLPAPFGGMKASGIGRDGGDYSFDFYMETKNICTAFGTHAIPKLGK